MEKNMVVVYENGIGRPFLLKPFGNQVMLLSPGLELSRLRVEALNWDNDDRESPNNYESRFNYLCMTGEEISSERMFALMMLNLNVGDAQTIKELMETLTLWDVSCSYTPVIFEIVLSKRERFGRMDYVYYGDGFFLLGMSSAEGIAYHLGCSLMDAIRANVFPEINLTIRNSGLDEAEYSLAKQRLMNIVGEEADIHVTFKKEED